MIKLRDMYFQLNVTYFSNLVIVCFFIYKTTESLLQSANRIHVYETVCTSLVNDSEKVSMCYKTNYMYLQINNTKTNTSSFFNFVKTIKFNEQTSSTEILIQRLSSAYLFGYRVLINFPATITCLMFGLWSYKEKNKYIIIIPSFGALIACICFASSLFIQIKSVSYAIVLIFLGSGIYGICGKSSAVTLGANSFITEFSDSLNRTRMLGRLLGVNCFGLSIGSFLLAIFYHFSGYTSILIFSFCSNLFLILIFILFVPKVMNQSINKTTNVLNIDKKTESLKFNEFKYRINCKPNCNEILNCVCLPGKQIKQSYFSLFKNSENSKNIYFFILLASVLFIQMTKSGEQDVLLLYLTTKPFNLNAKMYGYYFTFYYGCMAIILVFLLPIVDKYLKPKDTTLILIGLFLKFVRLITTGLTNDVYVVFAAAIVGSFAGFITSGIRALISKLMHGNEIGASFALISCMETIANLFGGSLFSLIYAITLPYFNGFIFIVDAVMHMCLIVIFLWLRYKLFFLETSENNWNLSNEPQENTMLKNYQHKENLYNTT